LAILIRFFFGEGLVGAPACGGLAVKRLVMKIQNDFKDDSGANRTWLCLFVLLVVV
jgi:hypothetical protein